VVEEATVDEDGDVVATEDACGIIIDCGLGLAEACVTKDRLPDVEGRLPNEYDDLCQSVSFVSESVPTDPVEPTPEFSFNEDGAVADSDPTLPQEDDFQTFGDWVNRHGVFRYRENESNGDVILTADSAAMRNVVTYEPTPAIVTTLHKRVQAVVELRSGPAGALRNGAVVANYQETSTGSGRFSYYVAEVDWDGQYRGFKLFRIAKYSGSAWINLFSIATPNLQRDAEYRLTLDIYPQPTDANDAWMIARLESVADSSIDVTIGPLAINNYAPVTGLFGLGTNRSTSRFRSFTVENITTAP
jgi:hypothetical protein